jgi:hypothetical protein
MTNHHRCAPKSEPFLHTTPPLRHSATRASCLAVRHTYFENLIAQLLMLFASCGKSGHFCDACPYRTGSPAHACAMSTRPTSAHRILPQARHLVLDPLLVVPSEWWSVSPVCWHTQLVYAEFILRLLFRRNPARTSASLTLKSYIALAGKTL